MENVLAIVSGYFNSREVTLHVSDDRTVMYAWLLVYLTCIAVFSLILYPIYNDCFNWSKLGS
jgi:hypothetical protein